MPNTSISYHKFKMYKKYNPGQIIALNSFRKKGLIAVFEDYIKSNCVKLQKEKDHSFLKYNESGKSLLTNEESNDNKDKSSYTFLYWNKYKSGIKEKEGTDGKKRNDFYYIHFIVLGGKKGDFKLICSPQGEITSIQTPEEAGMNFFNILVAIPCSPDAIEGMIILEHKGIFSVQSSFFHNFSKFYKDDSIKLEISNISNYEVIQSLIDTKPIRELKLIKYFKDADSSKSNYCEQEKRIFIKPQFSNLKAVLKGMFRSGRCIGTQISRIDQFNPNDVSVTFDVGNNKNKTYGISNFQNIALVEYVGEQDGIEYDQKFEPTFDSIELIMMQRYETNKAMLRIAENN